MIDLREHSNRIVEWLVSELARFQAEHAEVQSPHVALYCCPWSGWISLCLDSRVQQDQNCPDFEFVEFALYEAPDWAAQYEAAHALTIAVPDDEHQALELTCDGDEGLNRIFYEFLRDLLRAPETLQEIAKGQLRPKRFGVQLLDSQYGSSWDQLNVSS